MAAGRIVVPGWMPAVNADGVPIPNAQMYFYLNMTTTLATVYADMSLTTPLPNPVAADSSGQFPAIWADDANLFSVSVDALYGPPGVPFTFDDLGPSTTTNPTVTNKADRDGVNVLPAFADDAPYQSGLTDTFSLAYAEKFAETRNILEWINPSKHAAIKDGTLAGNLNDEIQTAVNSGAQRIFVPPGRYPINTVGFSVTMNTPNVTLFGAGPDSKFIDVAPPTSEARSVFLTTAADITLQDFYVDSDAALKVNPTWVPPGTTGAVALGGALNLMGDRNKAIRLTVVRGWDNCIGVGKYNLTTGNQTDSAPFGCIVSECYTEYAGSGIQSQNGYLISLGAGVNNLTGIGTVIENCIDRFSKVGHVNDFAGGARASFSGCKAYFSTRSIYPLDSDPNIPEGFTAAQLRPGGFGFYFAGNVQVSDCDAFDSARYGYWFDGYCFNSYARGLFAKGCREGGAWVQGRDNDIEIMAENCSYLNTDVYPAVLIEGAAASGGVFVASTNLTVSVQASGSFHKYALHAKPGFGLSGQFFTGAVSGVTAPILNETPASFHCGGQGIANGQRTTGLLHNARNNSSAITNPFGDTPGNNGNMWLSNFDNMAKRLAMGIDGARSVAVIQGMEAGVGTLPVEINTSGSPTRVHSSSNTAATLGESNNPGGLEAIAIQNRNKKVAVAYNGQSDRGEIQALTAGASLSQMAINPSGGGIYLGGGSWGQPLVVRGEAGVSSYLWVDDVGRLWIRSGTAPTSITNGTIVGTQS